MNGYMSIIGFYCSVGVVLCLKKDQIPERKAKKGGVSEFV
jgi:hypothetical protein